MTLSLVLVFAVAGVVVIMAVIGNRAAHEKPKVTVLEEDADGVMETKRE